MEAVIFGDAAAVAIGYLRAELGLYAEVHKDIPDPRPAKFVTVRRGGGIRRSVVSDQPLLLVECWAETSEDAHDLAQMCRGLLYAMRGTVQGDLAVYRVDEVGGPADLPDPLSNQSRYTFTVQVHLRCQAALLNS